MHTKGTCKHLINIYYFIYIVFSSPPVKGGFFMSKKRSKEEIRIYMKKYREKKKGDDKKENEVVKVHKSIENPIGYINDCENTRKELLNDGREADGVLARVWTFILYEDNAPINWRQIITDLHVSWACSCIHDKDLTAMGTRKKPHYHIVLQFDGKKSYKQIMAINNLMSGLQQVQVVGSLRQMIRYLAHLDDADKYQYPISSLENHGINQFDYYLMQSDKQEELVLKDITMWLMHYDIREFADLYIFSMENNPLWLYYCNKKSATLTRIINSLRHMNHRPFNPETGELYHYGRKEDAILVSCYDWSCWSFGILFEHMNHKTIVYR